MLRPSLLAALLIASSFAHAQDELPSGLVFHASFEGALDADFAGGDATGTAEGAPEFVAGHDGQGLMVGDIEGSAAAVYQREGNFDPERGTLAMWVQPVNWEGEQSCYRPLFQMRLMAGGQFLLYKHHAATNALWFFLEPSGAPMGKMYARASISDWGPGKWHHVAITWTRYEGMAIYVDGEQRQHLADAGLLDEPFEATMRFGSDWEAKGGRTVLDEAMIFDRMLAPGEIAALGGRADDPPENPRPDDIPGVMLAHAFLGQRVLARVWPDCLGEPAVEAARLTLTPEAGGDAVAEVEAILEDELQTLDLKLTDLPHGMYVARVDLLRGGEVAGSESLVISKETDDTWESAARIGVADTVLPRFEPLTVDGNAVSCYAKRYEFSGSGLPGAVTARGEAMLAGPVRVVARTADGELKLRDGAPAMGRATDVQADLGGSLSGEGLDVQVKTVARYDGTVWHTLRFTAREGLALESLRIEVPLAPTQAELFAWHAPGRYRERWGYGALPEAEGVVWADEFIPSLWLGSEDRGLGWYAESDEHWDIEGEDALTIERGPDETVLAMNIIRAPRELAGEFTIEFGLQATPVRPLEPGWRSNQWLPSRDISRFFLGLRERPFDERDIAGQTPNGKIAYLYTHHKYFTNTLPRDPGEFREMIERAKGYGLLTIPYTEARLIPEAFGDVLMRREGMLADPPVRAATYGAACSAGGCHAGLFGDWFVWYVSHMAREYGSNGIYLDEMWPNGCASAAHGCGYVGPDGKRRKTYAVRACLESYRRLRQMFVERGEPFWIAYHISGGRVPPLPTFGDCLLIAEERYGIVAENPDYLGNTKLDEWRASFCPEAWGIPIVAIPQFKMSGEWMKDPELAHRLMAAIVPHDVMVWPLFSETDAIMQVRDALMAFGIGEEDAGFIGYWEEDAGIECPDERVVVSAYTRPGQILLCVTNRSDDEIARVPISVDLRKLGLAGVSATDQITGEGVAIAGGVVTLAMPAKSLRLLKTE
jgi:hypothetical protein